MTLNDVWFVLFILIIAGYLILDGFDMGVGILLLPLARTDVERRTFLNSIGPVWDGNEVWLVLGGGVLFAVFPLAYASLFSGLYLAFMLVLLVLILRTVALEFRSQGADAALAVRLGHRLRRRVGRARPAARHRLREHRGRPAGRRRRATSRSALIGLLTPFALLVGVTTVAMFAVQGGIYLLIKTDGELHDRIERAVPRLMVVVLRAQHARRGRVGAVPPEHLGAVSRRHLAGHPPGRRARRARRGMGVLRRGETFRAFLASSAMIGLLLISGGSGSTRTSSSRRSTRPTT